MPPQPLANATSMIGSITTQMSGALARATTAAPDAYTAGDSLELGRLVGLRGQHAHTKRKTLTITQEVQLGAKPTLGPA